MWLAVGRTIESFEEVDLASLVKLGAGLWLGEGNHPGFGRRRWSHTSPAKSGHAEKVAIGEVESMAVERVGI